MAKNSSSLVTYKLIITEANKKWWRFETFVYILFLKKFVGSGSYSVTSESKEDKTRSSADRGPSSTRSADGRGPSSIQLVKEWSRDEKKRDEFPSNIKKIALFEHT